MKKIAIVLGLISLGAIAHAAAQFQFVSLEPVKLSAAQANSLATTLSPVIYPHLDAAYGLSGGKACSLARYFRRVPNGQPNVQIWQGEDGSWYVSGTAALPVTLAVGVDGDVE